MAMLHREAVGVFNSPSRQGPREFLSCFFFFYCMAWGSLSGVMANVLGCVSKVKEFEFQWHNCDYCRTNTFEKDMTPPSPPAMGISTVLLQGKFWH